ncbi:MAG: hypothetical protein LBC73_09210 [Oscillospiraceae bacterium]|jgi:glucan phosphoethanolaminetransferase (alkaline phosphatase superfamily)|nr:hypothetical protein [Oscillospiraceae bacterium]
MDNKDDNNSEENIGYVKFEATFWLMFATALMAIATVANDIFAPADSIRKTIIAILLIIYTGIIIIGGFYYKNRVYKLYRKISNQTFEIKDLLDKKKIVQTSESKQTLEIE